MTLNDQSVSALTKTRRYAFLPVDRCNMCGAGKADHAVLGRRLDRPQGMNPRKVAGISTTVMKCRACGLVFADPQPVPADLQDHYGVPPESYWKESYFTADPSYFQGEIQRLRQLMEIKPGTRSLDIGAGLGKAMTALAQAGFDSYGLEPSLPFHERAVGRMGIPADKLKLGMMEEVDYPSECFDFITFGAVLEHLYDPSASILKAMSWLKPNGIIHIEVPSSRWLVSRLVNLIYRWRGTDHVANISPMHEPFHLYEFDLRSFNAHARKNGYTVAFHEHYVCETYLPKLLDPILKPWMQWTGTGMQLCVWLRKSPPHP
jgi:SAM-dependent methyltransferase